MKSSIPQVRLVKPKLPEYKTGHMIAFFVAGFLWIGLMIIFVFSVYVRWFQVSFSNIVRVVTKSQYFIPFWLAYVLAILFFPVTLAFILADGLQKIVQHSKVK